MAPGPLLDVALPTAPALSEKTQEVADEVLAKGSVNQENVDYAFRGGLIAAAGAAAIIAQSKVHVILKNPAASCNKIGKSRRARCSALGSAIAACPLIDTSTRSWGFGCVCKAYFLTLTHVCPHSLTAS